MIHNDSHDNNDRENDELPTNINKRQVNKTLNKQKQLIIATNYLLISATLSAWSSMSFVSRMPCKNSLPKAQDGRPRRNS